MKNHLRLLRKENKQRSEKLIHRRNKDMLEKWKQYAKESEINPYEYELCCKKLIDFAEHREADHSIKDLQHFFGEDQKFIAENIIEGCRKKTMLDYLLFDTKNLAGILAIVLFLLLLLFRSSFEPMPLHLVLFTAFTLILLPLWCKFFSLFKVRRFYTDKKLNIKEGRKFFVCLLSYALVHIIFDYAESFVCKTYYLTIPNIILPVSLIIIWIVLSLFQLVYVDKLAKERPWQDIN